MPELGRLRVLRLVPAPRTEKVFCLSLPRTGTTSIAATLMDLGLRTCHVVPHPRLYQMADAFADSPVYADYAAIDQRYPNSRFIYIERHVDDWLPSFVRIYRTFWWMLQNPATPEFEMTRRAHLEIFGTIAIDEDRLISGFLRHREQVQSYFRGRDDLLTISLRRAEDYGQLCDFLHKPKIHGRFPILNRGGEAHDWHRIDHPNKVASDDVRVA